MKGQYQIHEGLKEHCGKEADRKNEYDADTTLLKGLITSNEGKVRLKVGDCKAIFALRRRWEVGQQQFDATYAKVISNT